MLKINVKDGNMNNNNFVLLDISKQLKRIADALEESNSMIKDLGSHENK